MDIKRRIKAWFHGTVSLNIVTVNGVEMDYDDIWKVAAKDTFAVLKIKGDIVIDVPATFFTDEHDKDRKELKIGAFVTILTMLLIPSIALFQFILPGMGLFVCCVLFLVPFIWSWRKYQYINYEFYQKYKYLENTRSSVS